MKPVVMGVIVKRMNDAAGYREWRILTQIRIVQNKSYDPLYDRTHEAVGETIESHKETGRASETVLDALLRGIAEECGAPDCEPVAIYGASMKPVKFATHTTGKSDIIVEVEPFSFVQQLGLPQPWIGPVFVVEFPENWEPDRGKSDGEAGEPTWWDPAELAQAIKQDPGKFMGLHMPALLRAAIQLGEENFTRSIRYS